MTYIDAGIPFGLQRTRGEHYMNINIHLNARVIDWPSA